LSGTLRCPPAAASTPSRDLMLRDNVIDHNAVRQEELQSRPTSIECFPQRVFGATLDIATPKTRK